MITAEGTENPPEFFYEIGFSPLSPLASLLREK
jgi:hypothetical protein